MFKNIFPIIKFPFLFFTFCIFIFSQNLFAKENLENKEFYVDLTGEWEIIQMNCLYENFDCGTNLKENKILFPSDFRKYFPDFYGTAIFRKEFLLKEIPVDDAVFIAGAIGSSDKVHVNGKLIGAIGKFYELGHSSVTWMIPREYRIDNNYLQIGSNFIEIEIGMYDEKAGIYSSPLAITNEVEASDQLSIKYLLMLFLPFSIFGICGFITFYIFIAWTIRTLPNFYLLFIGASSSYLFMVSHFLPISLPIPYNLSIQMYLSGGLFAASFIFLFYQRVLKQKFDKLDIILTGIGILLVPVHFIKSDFNYIYTIAKPIHAYVVLLLFVLLSTSIRGFNGKYKSKVFCRITFPAALLILLANAWDLSVRLQWMEQIYIFNYFSMLYSTLIIIFHTQQMVESKTNAEELKNNLMADRIRIARDLHDIVGAELTGLLHLSKTPDGRERIYSEIGERVSQILDNIRELIYVMNLSERIEQSFKERIQKYLVRLNSLNRFQIQTELMEIEPSLSIRKIVELNKIFLESMTNIIKHSNATAIRVIWKRKGNRLILCIIDNGIGMDRTEIIQSAPYSLSKNHGLNNIRHRARSIEAQLKIFTRINQGTTVCVSFQI